LVKHGANIHTNDGEALILASVIENTELVGFSKFYEKRKMIFKID